MAKVSWDLKPVSLQASVPAAGLGTDDVNEEGGEVTICLGTGVAQRSEAKPSARG